MTELAANAHLSRREFTVLMALLISITAMSIDALLPALGFIGQQFQVANQNHVQFLISGIFIGNATGQLLAGPLSDAVGRKKVIYGGLLIYFLGSAVCFFAASFPMLVVGRLIQGFGVAAPQTMAITVVRDKYHGRDMAQMMSLVMMIFIMVPAIAPSIGQAVMLASSWRMIFVMYIAYAIIVGGWVSLRLVETLPAARRVPFSAKNLAHGFREVMRNRLTVSYMVAAGICMGCLIGYLNSSQQIFQEHFKVGDMFTIYFGALALMIGASSLVNSRIVQRLGMRYISLRAVAGVVGISVLFLALHFVVPITLPLFLGYAGLLLFCFGMLFGNLNAMAMEPMGHIAGLAAAIIGATSSLLSMAIGTTIGQLYNDTLIPLAACIAALGTVAWFIVRYASHQHTVEAP